MPHPHDNTVDPSDIPFGELIAVQQRDLANWQKLLKPRFFTALTEHCQKTNRVGNCNAFHVCLRGDDLLKVVAKM